MTTRSPREIFHDLSKVHHYLDIIPLDFDESLLCDEEKKIEVTVNLSLLSKEINDNYNKLHKLKEILSNYIPERFPLIFENPWLVNEIVENKLLNNLTDEYTTIIENIDNLINEYIIEHNNFEKKYKYSYLN